MAPRIQNISADEFRRLFQAPEIQTPGINVADFLTLQQAFEKRRENALLKASKEKEAELKAAEIDAKLREIEAQKQLGTSLASPFEEKIREIEQNLAAAEQTPTGVQVAGETQQVPGIGEVAAPRPELLGETEEFIPTQTAAEQRIDELSQEKETVQSLVAVGELDKALKAARPDLVTVTGSDQKLQLETPDGRVIFAFRKPDGSVTNLAGRPIDAQTLSESIVGFAQENKIVGTNVDGISLLKDRRGNITNSDTGEAHKGVIFPSLKNAPASIVNSLSQFRASKALLSDLSESFKNTFTGPLAGRFTKVEDMFGSSDPKVARFVAQLRTYQNAMIKAITGAQMSENEAKRLIAQMPDFKDNPKAFIAKLLVAAESADRAMASHLKALQAGGFAIKEDIIDEGKASDLVKDKFGALVEQSLPSSGDNSAEVQAIDAELAEIERQLKEAQ